MKTTDQFTDRLALHIRSRYPLIVVRTFEEQRLLDVLKKALEDSPKQKDVLTWSEFDGLCDGKGKVVGSEHHCLEDDLQHIAKYESPAVFVLFDTHNHFRNTRAIRGFRSVAACLKNSFKTIVMVSPYLELPADLEKDAIVLDMPLPSKAEIRNEINTFVGSLSGGKVTVSLDEDTKELMAECAQGLTLAEVQRVLGKMVVEDKKLDSSDINILLEEKAQIVKKAASLEYVDLSSEKVEVGGLDRFRGWIERRKAAFSDEAGTFGIRKPKGVLLLGFPGCGKSLCAKYTAQQFKMPLIKLNMGMVQSRWHGESEANFFRAISFAESVSPCVLWIDEIEKAFGQSTSGDSDVANRILGAFLFWLQEKKSLVFVFATANRIEKIPPELIRKGRFDEAFFLGLPAFEERRDIFGIHIAKTGRNPSNYDLEKLAKESQLYSGAEIESVVQEALFEAFYHKVQLDDEVLSRQITETKPLYTKCSEQFDELQQWAKERAVFASKNELSEG